jgi:hypothetical protein
MTLAQAAESVSSHLPQWVTIGIVAIISGLASAVVFMFKLGQSVAEKRLLEVQEDHTKDLARLLAENEVLKKETAECRKDREQTRIRLAALETRLEMISGDVSKNYAEQQRDHDHGGHG